MAEQIPFRRKLTKTGGGVTVNIPSEILQHYGWSEGEEVCIITDTNKKGQRYMAVYKEGQ